MSVSSFVSFLMFCWAPCLNKMQAKNNIVQIAHIICSQAYLWANVVK